MIRLDMLPEERLTAEEKAVVGKLYTCWGVTYRLAGFRENDGPWMVDVTGKELPRTVSHRAIGRTFREVRGRR